MTETQQETKINEIKKLLDDNYVSCSVESFVDPVGMFTRWVLFVYSDEDHKDTLGKLETKIHPETAVLDLFWSVKWYSLLDPVQGVYHPLYEYDCGWSDTLDEFIDIVVNKIYRQEKQKEKDIQIKRITEE